MDGIQKLVIVGVLIGSAMVTLTGLLVAKPQPAQASASGQAIPAETSSASGDAGQQGEGVTVNAPEGGCAIGKFPVSITRWCELIQYHARENGLDPILVAAVVLQESGGDPQAYSSSGAVGLMQVMPRDGIAAGFMCVNGPCFASRPSTAELFEPEFNVSYGTRFLAGLVGKYGSYRQALFAYGPMGVGFSYADKVLALAERYR